MGSTSTGGNEGKAIDHLSYIALRLLVAVAAATCRCRYKKQDEAEVDYFGRVAAAVVRCGGRCASLISKQIDSEARVAGRYASIPGQALCWRKGKELLP